MAIVKILALLAGFLVSVQGQAVVQSVSGCLFGDNVDPALSVGTYGCSSIAASNIVIRGQFDSAIGRPIKVFLESQPISVNNADTTGQVGLYGSFECSYAILTSTTTIDATCPPAFGVNFQVLLEIDGIQGTIYSTVADPTKNATVSYLSGGYEQLLEGGSHYTDFMENEGGSPAGFMGSTCSSLQLATGFTAQPTADSDSDMCGKLNSTMWRAHGLYGLSACSAPPIERTNFQPGRCDTQFGYGNGYSYVDNAQAVAGRPAPADLTSLTTLAQGGVMSLATGAAGSSAGGLGFLPYNRSTVAGMNDFAPGSLDLRLVNSMGQVATGLKVKYSLQCSNQFPATTTVMLGWTEYGAEDRFYNFIPSTKYTSTGACSECNTCSANDATCFYSNQVFVETEITGFFWRPSYYMYLRWAIDTDAGVGEYGDPCRITDLETIPFVTESGDYSLELKGNSSFDVQNSGGSFYYPAGTNWTVSMALNPSSHVYPDASVPDSIPRALVSNDLTILSAGNSSSFLGLMLDTSSPAGPYPVRLWSLAPGTPDSIVAEWSSGAIIPADRWSHFAIGCQVVGAETTFLLYVNGALAYTSPAMTEVAFGEAAGAFRFGKLAYPLTSSTLYATTGYTGHMDELRLWSTLRTEAQIHEDMDNTVDASMNPNLAVYLRLDSVMPTTTSPYDMTTASLVGDYSGNMENCVSSQMSAVTLLGLSGGTVTCSEQYITPLQSVSCSFTVMNQAGVTMPTLDQSQFYVSILSGLGSVGPLTPDYSNNGATWSFTFYSPNVTGTTTMQAYTKTGDEFSGYPTNVVTVSEGCRACEWRERYGGVDYYSCNIGGRSFIRSAIANKEGSCPL